MKQAITPGYTFTPATRQLDLSSVSGFDIKKLFAVINATAGQTIYATGQSGYGYTALTGSVITLAFNTTAMSASDNLVILYDADNASVVSGSVSVSNLPATQAVSAAALPLPTGAATESTLATMSGKFTTTASGVKVDGSSVTQPISGSVSVSNFPSTQAVSVSSLPLPSNAALESGGNLAQLVTNTTGLATAALQATANTELTSIDAKTLTPLTRMPYQTDSYIPVRPLPLTKIRTTFAKTISNNVDTQYLNLITTGSGQTVNQTGGNLVLTTGTTTNSETIIRSVQSIWDAYILKYSATLSQRIANNNFFIEMVDVIGDNLAMTINSATSVTITIPSNPFDATNVGQSIYIGAVSVAAAVPGRYAIASVAGNAVTFTVAGWPASGSGTCSLFGWNYQHVIYNGVTATNALYDAQRRGWNSGDTTATINTTASPGHVGIIQNEDGVAVYLDQLAASGTVTPTAVRAQRVQNIPAQETQLYLQIRSLNGSTAPASTTTFTVGFVSVENYASQSVSLHNVKAQSLNTPLPTTIQNSPAVTISSGTVTTVSTVSAMTSGNLGIPGLIADVASAALTTTTTTAAFTPTFGTSYSVNIPVTVVSGTTPTLDVQIQESDDTGTNWYAVYDFPRITATGMYRSPVISFTGNRVRYVQTVGGTTPSFTRAINRLQRSSSDKVLRQMIDRSITLTTLSSTTPTLTVQGTSNLQLTINIGAATTPPAIQLQCSDDAGTTWYKVGSPLTAVASSTVSVTLANITTQLVQAIVTTAGSAVTAGYVLVRGF